MKVKEIKGITVKVGVDTTELDATLEKAQRLESLLRKSEAPSASVDKTISNVANFINGIIDNGRIPDPETIKALARLIEARTLSKRQS